MSSLKELRNSRLEKLGKLKKLGIDPYPAKSHRNVTIGEILGDFEHWQSKEVVVAGRIVSLRSHGSILFVDLKDASGKIQILVKKDGLTSVNNTNSELSFDDLGLLDEGDFVESHGQVLKSQRGEMSIDAKIVRILTKSIRPMPGAWDGLKDKETRLRRRYLDTNINLEVYQRFLRRAKFWEAHREFFKTHGFYEINIPVLELVPGGADAKPFVTHMDAIDQDFYLRISQELYLKRLIGGGYEKVYEIGPRFRNEGISDEHLPEHIAMEFYWAYADYNDGMEFIKELFRFVAQEVYGTQKFKMRGFDVDLSADWEKIDYVKLMKDKTGLDVLNPDDEKIQEVLKQYKIRLPKYTTSRAIDHIWKELRKEIAGPAFIVGEPKALSPLAKSDPKNPLITQRFHPILAGSELGNAFSELNDPIDQLARFREQQGLRESGDAEAQFLDIDFVEMLEYGMPPTFGYGHSERVFWFFEDVTAKEGVPFPQLKFELDDSTKEIYGLLEPERIKLPTDFSTGATVYTLDPVLKNRFPGMFYAYCEITDVKISKKNAELEDLKKNVVSRASGKTQTEVDKIEPVVRYRELFKETGVDLHKCKPSPDALLKRLIAGKGLYNINTAVDAYNMAVIQTGVGLGGFDSDKVSPPVELRFSTATDKAHLLGEDSEESVGVGRIVYADSKRVLTVDLNYRDSDVTKITEKTKNILLFADGAPGLDRQEVVDALKLGAEYIHRFCDGSVGEVVVVS